MVVSATARAEIGPHAFRQGRAEKTRIFGSARIRPHQAPSASSDSTATPPRARAPARASSGASTAASGGAAPNLSRASSTVLTR